MKEIAKSMRDVEKMVQKSQKSLDNVSRPRIARILFQMMKKEVELLEEPTDEKLLEIYQQTLRDLISLLGR